MPDPRNWAFTSQMVWAVTGACVGRQPGSTTSSPGSHSTHSTTLPTLGYLSQEPQN